MITYNSFPTLLFASYTKDNAPEELPFECVSDADRRFLTGSKGFQEMFGGIASSNSLGKKPTNYWLSDRQFQAVENDGSFRNQHFVRFMQRDHSLQYGVIAFKQGGQYIYTILNAVSAKNIKGVNGPYVAVALFLKNTFLGFEEGFLASTGLQVMPTARYNAMDIGGYISFVAITLSYMSDAKKDAPDNRTTEKILYKI